MLDKGDLVKRIDEKYDIEKAVVVGDSLSVINAVKIMFNCNWL